MIKIYNISALVICIGINNGTLQFNPKTEEETEFPGYDIPIDMFNEKQEVFFDYLNAGLLKFDAPGMVAPLAATITGTEITVEDINKKTGDEIQPPTDDKEPVVPPSTSTTLTAEELAGLETMDMNQLRDIAKRIGAEPSRKSSELVAHIKAKVAADTTPVVPAADVPPVTPEA